jgi:hypothetical protein
MSEPLQDAASRGVRERGEGDIQSTARILNHVVQYAPTDLRVQGGSTSVDLDAERRASGARDVRGREQVGYRFTVVEVSTRP